MIDVHQDAGFEMAGFDGSAGALTEAIEVLGESPQLELWDDASLVA